MDITSVYSIIKGNRFIGLSALRNADGISFHGCVVVKKKDEYKIESTFSFEKDLSLLHKNINGNYPLILHLDGIGIIHKLCDTIDSKIEQLLPTIFPGLQLNEYIVQSHPLREKPSFISVVRKSIVEELIIELKQLGFYVVSINLGPFLINSFLPELGIKNNLLRIYDTEIEVEENCITKLTKKDDLASSVIRFQGEVVDSDFLIPFCVVLSHLTENLEFTREITVVENNNTEIKYRRRFYSILYTVPFGLFLVLGINFLFFSHYTRQISKNSQIYEQNSGILNQLKHLESEYVMKKDFIQSYAISNKKVSLPYCDFIGASVPEKIKLNILEVNPVINRIKNNKRIIYANRLIKIDGIAENESVLRNWIGILSNENWIKQVKISKYNHNEGNPVQFELELNYN